MPEFCIALLIAKAEAMVMRMSQEINFVYLRAGKMFITAIITVTTQTKKNMSNFMPGTSPCAHGNSPIAAPNIMSARSTMVNQRFLRPIADSFWRVSATSRKKEESPQLRINLSSASTTTVSPSRKCSLRMSCMRRVWPLRLSSKRVAPYFSLKSKSKIRLLMAGKRAPSTSSTRKYLELGFSCSKSPRSSRRAGSRYLAAMMM